MNDRQRSPEEAAPQLETNGAKPEEARPASRRSLFGAGLLGALALVAQACSGTDFAGGVTNRKKDGEKNSGGDGNDGDGDADADAGGPDSGAPDSGAPDSGAPDAGDAGADAGADSGGDSGGPDLGDGSDQASCHANSASQLDLTNAGDIDQAPKVKFYGKQDSALVAIKPAGNMAIGFIILTSPTGKLLAIHGITGADKDAAGNYRPIVIDNLCLKDKGTAFNEIMICYQNGDEVKKHKEPVAFFTSFDGKNVVDLCNGGAIAANMGNWSVTQFYSGTSAADDADDNNTRANFSIDNTITYPNDYNGGSVRNLLTVKGGTKWTKGSGVKGTVTDIMGDPIPGDMNGQALLEYQIFCTYVTSGTTVYRTILHVG